MLTDAKRFDAVGDRRNVRRELNWFQCGPLWDYTFIDAIIIIYSRYYAAVFNVSMTTAENIGQLIRRSPDDSAVDSLPTLLSKRVCVEEMSPFIAKLCTQSMADGLVPESLKETYITPLLK